MANLLGVFFDANGTPKTAVLTAADNFVAHQQDGYTLAVVSVEAAKLLHDPHELKKACISALASANKNLAAKAQIDCDAVDAQRAADKKAAIDTQAAALLAWNALDPAVRQAAIDADAALGQAAIAP